jgi:anti-sigma factor RsiW
MDRKTEFEGANAFIDGELDREGRSEVLARAARDPRAAQELADLNRLKAVLEDSIEVPEIPLPARAGKTRRRLALALAASLVLMASPGPSEGLPVAWAIKAHKGWRGAPDRPAAPRLRPASLMRNAYVPDLTAAKLAIAHIGEIKAPGGVPALVVGYSGTRGCRVTLIVDPAPKDLGGSAMFFETEGLLAMVWRAGPLRHQILAQGMDPTRFRMIAESVRRGSLDHLPLDKRTRLALARSRASSPPCAV